MSVLKLKRNLSLKRPLHHYFLSFFFKKKTAYIWNFSSWQSRPLYVLSELHTHTHTDFCKSRALKDSQAASAYNKSLPLSLWAALRMENISALNWPAVRKKGNYSRISCTPLLRITKALYQRCCNPTYHCGSTGGVCRIQLGWKKKSQTWEVNLIF